MMSTLGLTVTTVGNAIQYSDFLIPYSVNLPVAAGPLTDDGLGNQTYISPLQTRLHGKATRPFAFM